MKRRDLLFLFVSVFVIVASWVIFNVYHNATISTISKQLALQTSPIDASFDLKALDQLKLRENITPLYDIRVGTSSAALSIDLHASASASLSAQTASQGGRLR